MPAVTHQLATCTSRQRRMRTSTLGLAWLGPNRSRKATRRG